MKKLLLIILLVSSNTFSRAQSYHPLLDSINRWAVAANFLPVRNSNATTICNYPFNSFNPEDFYTDGDTTINAVVYKKIIADDQFGICLAGYVREDTSTQRVYFLSTTSATEELLYDFSIQNGDSLQLSFYASGSFYTTGNFTVDSIRTVTLIAGQRKIIYLTNHRYPWFQLEWIEGVGSPEHPFYTYSDNQGGGLMYNYCGGFGPGGGNQYFYGSFLTCFSHDSLQYFDSCAFSVASGNSCFFVADSCHYGNTCGNIDEKSMIKKLSLFPNPTQQELFAEVVVEQSAVYLFRIFDSNSKMVLSEKAEPLLIGTNKIKLNVTGLKPGFYFLECASKTGSVFRKLLIQ